MLPSAQDGYLPYLLLFNSIAATIHTVVCYASAPAVALKQFSGPKRPPPTLLLAHVYGIKNLYTALIRGYAAYYIGNQQVYDLAIFTFAGVLILYVGEFAVWRTASLREVMFPFVLSGSSLVWMLAQRDWYGR
ncbi:ergosterol biosynthesis protein-like protein Erg28 [Triangularia verruculosa]|uniref:Ergosterol biosynthesis protein-like protein Erg28 n=1 Tax=Triangularia verruculosa TaxID=2587418 RepID=A0AAN7AQC1_9PEZI|nr:ergosterol biosynthesis protein-like protein Erg28 [Triangularia verruculosa]